MADTVQQLVDDVLQEGQFDATSAQALRWLNRRHRKMCTRSRCYRKAIPIAGGTVAGQRDYALPADVIETYEVAVNGHVYGKARHADLAQGALGRLALSDDGGVFTADADAAGGGELALYPTPTEAGLTIELLVALVPPDLTLDGSAGGVLRVDADFTDELVSGAIATGLSRLEARPDLAATHEAAFAGACEEMRRRVQRRYRGSGPATIRVVGLNA